MALFCKIRPFCVVNNLVVKTSGYRFASKKSGTSASGANHGPPGHHGWKRTDGQRVSGGTTVAKQYHLRWFPGLNVGLGKRGELYAKVNGVVRVTCEKVDLKKDHPWVKKWYPDREGIMYKKYYNVIPDPQHCRFKLINQL